MLPRRLPPALAAVFTLLRLLPGASQRLTILLGVSILVLSLLPIAFTVVTGVLVGSVPGAVHAGLDSRAGHHSLSLVAIAAGLIVGQRMLAPLQQALSVILGRRLDLQLQERVMAAVSQPNTIAHLEDPEVLDLIRSAQGLGTQGLKPGDSVGALASLLPSWVQAVGSAVILATFRWWLGLMWLLLWPVILYYLQREYLRVGEVAGAGSGAARRADYYRDLALMPGPAKEIRIWGMTGWLLSRFQTAWTGAMNPIWQARKPGRTVVWASASVVLVVNLGTFALLAWAAVHGNLTLGALAVYSRAALDAGTFRAFDDQNMILAYAAVSVPSMLALERRLSSQDSSADLTLAPGSPRHEIRFENVSFRYAGQECDTISNLTLIIPAGRSLAVVGANGAGKTTFVKLLCRLYEPTSGRITVDGVDLREIDPANWRSHVAAIFQDFTRYHLSARDNVALGAPGLTDVALREAASRAGALELVENLPNGWNTVLSRQYMGGVDLSGGQWQRVALARALAAVESGSRVLILDEPSANLDVRAEAELYNRFLEITAGLTTILISHRFSTVRRTQEIVVLERGRIVETGTHDELMARGGDYARMFRLQADRFVAASDGRQ